MFFVALQVQEQWAYEHNVTLLAAGGNYPSLGSGGTGVYQGRSGPLVNDIVVEGGTKFYTAKVLKDHFSTYPLASYADKSLNAKLDDFYLIRDDLSSNPPNPSTISIFNSIFLFQNTRRCGYNRRKFTRAFVAGSSVASLMC